MVTVEGFAVAAVFVLFAAFMLITAFVDKGNPTDETPRTP